MRTTCTPPLVLLALLLVAAGPAGAASKSVRVTTPVFASAAAALRAALPDTAVPVPGTILPFVTGVSLCPSAGCDSTRSICGGDSIRVRVAGVFPDMCWGFDGLTLTWADPAPPRVNINIEHVNQQGCGQLPYSWSGEVMLPPLPAGSYQLQLAEHRVDADSLPILLTSIPLVVTDSCGGPPPGPGPLPFVDQVTICPTGRCGEPGQVICPTDSITVVLAGRLPSDCFFLRRIDVLPPLPTFRVAAPRLRLVVDNACCLGRPCLMRPTPWQAALTLPPLPAGPYDLTVMVAEVCCRDSAASDSLPTANFAFGVSDSCTGLGPGHECLVGHWIHPTIPEQCEGYIAPGQPAQITFALNNTVPLAALQGKFTMAWTDLPSTGTPIRITSVRPVGPAGGMHLSWTQTATGANFVMFADEGAPIPANPPGSSGPTPVLAIVAEAVAGVRLPPATYVTSFDLLGADAQAQGVPPCPIRIAPDVARICAEPGCDFNADGRIDVRDLVAMVRCVRNDACRVSSAFDCNADGSFSIDDVMCCALRILRGAPCTTCPPDSAPPKKEGSVRLTLGGAVKTAAGFDVPLTLERAERVGAARVALHYPAGRYDVTSVEMTPPSTDWLQVSEVENDQIVVGLIQIGNAQDGVLAGKTVAAQQVNVTLHLTLKAGQSPGGEISPASSDFSGPDGARIEIVMSTPTQPLGGGVEFALSENRPDPFTGETRFTLTLPSASEVDLGVYDVTGRRIATLHRGSLAAGVSEFRWNGRADGGARAQSGIYFYRATAGGRTASRKMVLLRGE